MATNMAVPVPLQALASKLGAASPEKSPVKVEHLSSPPPLIEDTSGILEDGEIDEHQGTVGSLRNELQLSTYEYSALEDRFKRLERQHSELQDLASAYSEVIRGFPAANGHTVSIDQLQAEAGRDGLRAKALEADVLRPLIREAGGLQALISQNHTMRTLIDKAGGLRELEQFVSDLRTIRDTLDEIRGSQGLGGLASEVQDLLKSKQEHAELESEVDGPNGLRAKAARYQKLMQAFTDVQTVTSSQERNATALTVSPARVTGNNGNAPSISHGQPARGQQLSAGPAIMNPARARMISATPLEADPDRDLYDAPPPIAKPNNKTGSNNTPLGIPQMQPASQLANQAASSSTLKRKAGKGAENTTSNVPAKRPRVDLGQGSALVQASLPTVINSPVLRASGQSNTTGLQAGAAAFRTRAPSVRGESEGTVMRDAGFRTQAQTAVASPKMPDWMRAGVRFGDVGFTSTPEARTPTYSSTPPRQDAEPHADTRSGPVRLPANKLSLLSSFSVKNSQGGVGGQAPVLATAALSGLQQAQLGALKKFFKHPIALWMGSVDGYTTWDAYPSYDLKRDAQIPDELLVFLLGELAKHVHTGNSSTYEQMAPSGNTCILRFVVDGHRPSGLPQERRVCRFCTSAWVGHSRPCALLQDVSGVRTIVFLPLREYLRTDKRWTDKAYWMRIMQ